MTDDTRYITCEWCNCSFKRRGLSQHQRTCKRKPKIPSDEEKAEFPSKKNLPPPPPKKKRKKKISPQMRALVWETYIGQKTRSTCFCCHKNEITPFTGWRRFEAGHIVSEANGGLVTIGNLLPICADCNGLSGMCATNWDDYVKYNQLPLREYGDNLPKKKKAHPVIVKIRLYGNFLNSTKSFDRKKREKFKKSKRRLWRF